VHRTRPAPIDEAILLRFTGQSAVRDPDAAERALGEAKTGVGLAGKQFTRSRRRRRYFAFRRMPARFGVPPWAATLILASAAAILLAAVMIATPFATLPMLLGEVFATYALLGGATYLALADRPGEPPEARRTIREAQWRSSIDEHVRAAAALQDAMRGHAAAERLLAAIREAQRSPLNHLLLVNVRALNRLQFEQYLIELLRALGYRVRRASVGAGGAGGWGVDLIAELSQDYRVAISARCDPALEVGPDVVQQAHNGMAFHGCRSGAVFTNGGYTAAARTFAEDVQCVLVDPDQIRSLVRGELRLANL
jgi:hypothetical protein